MSHEGRAGADGVHPGAELGGEHEDGRLRGTEAPVERLEDGAPLPAREEEAEELHAVVSEHGATVTPTDAERRVQEGGSARGGGVPLVVRDSALAMVGVDEGGAVRVERGAAGQSVMDDGHGPTRHPTTPGVCPVAARWGRAHPARQHSGLGVVTPAVQLPVRYPTARSVLR